MQVRESLAPSAITGETWADPDYGYGNLTTFTEPIHNLH
jgi:hypothetical protein